MIKRGLVAALLFTTACSNPVDEEEDFTCAVGKLNATWQFHYEETNGTCGPIPDQTGVFEPGSPTAPGCDLDSQIITSDKCRVDSSYTCPTSDGLAVQGWTLSLTQVAKDRLTGTGTVQVNHPTLGNCRSTYRITVTRL